MLFYILLLLYFCRCKKGFQPIYICLYNYYYNCNRIYIYIFFFFFIFIFICNFICIGTFGVPKIPKVPVVL